MPKNIEVGYGLYDESKKCDVKYNIDAANTANAPIASSKPKIQKSTPTTVTKLSDVDQNIPVGSGNNENTFAVIIANENYQNETNVSMHCMMDASSKNIAARC